MGQLLVKLALLFGLAGASVGAELPERNWLAQRCLLAGCCTRVWVRSHVLVSSSRWPLSIHMLLKLTVIDDREIPFFNRLWHGRYLTCPT